MLLDKIKNKAEYKSSIRSRKLIRDAFIKCLDKKDVEKITVTDIVKEAEINRSTFYAHYKCARDVIEEIANEFIEEVNSVLADFNLMEFLKKPEVLLRKFLDYVNSDQEMLSRLVSLHQVDIFINQIRQKIYDYIYNEKSLPKALKKNVHFACALDFFINAVVYSFRDKIASNPPIEDEKFIETISYFMANNFKLVKKFIK